MMHLTFLGDIFPSDELFTEGFGIMSKTNEQNLSRWKKDIIECVGSADYIIGNLESPLVEEKDIQGETFYGKPLFAELLKDCGINVLNVANNHIMEHGVQGFNSTLKTLNENCIVATGYMKDNLPAITTIQHDGTKFAIAAFCDERVCSCNNPGCYASLDEQSVMNSLKRMKANGADVIIFIFHWGNEYITIPSLEQRQLAYKLIDNGASIVVGHHPHVVQPYEQYNGGHIIYSLGNFCFDDVQSKQFGKGMMAHVTFEYNKIVRITFAGVEVQDMAYTNHLVLPMSVKRFTDYFGEINNSYVSMAPLPDADYQRIYMARLLRNHSSERIKMRLSIIRHLMHPLHKYRGKLFGNIIHYIRKYL